MESVMELSTKTGVFLDGDLQSPGGFVSLVRETLMVVKDGNKKVTILDGSF